MKTGRLTATLLGAVALSSCQFQAREASSQRSEASVSSGFVALPAAMAPKIFPGGAVYLGILGDGNAYLTLYGTGFGKSGALIRLDCENGLTTHFFPADFQDAGQINVKMAPFAQKQSCKVAVVLGEQSSDGEPVEIAARPADQNLFEQMMSLSGQAPALNLDEWNYYYGLATKQPGPDPGASDLQACAKSSFERGGGVYKDRGTRVAWNTWCTCFASLRGFAFTCANVDSAGGHPVAVRSSPAGNPVPSNLRRIGKYLFSAQPDLADGQWRGIRDLGVRTDLDLRPVDEDYLGNEMGRGAGYVLDLGKIWNGPLTVTGTSAVVDLTPLDDGGVAGPWNFKKAENLLDWYLRQGNCPMLTHCHAGIGRTGQAEALLAYAVYGVPMAQAIVETDRAGNGGPDARQIEFLNAFAKDHPAGYLAPRLPASCR